MTRHSFICRGSFILLCFVYTILLSASLFALEPKHFDVVVYGGTSGGVAAAVQTRRMGKTVVLIEPSQHLGGLTSGGLGATDIGNKGAIGGISREFYQRVKKHYAAPDAWKQEAFRSDRNPEDAMWTFEPHVAEKIMNDFCQEYGVVVLTHERLDWKQGVELADGKIKSICLESGKIIHGAQYIDATYEGDLMAQAKVRFTVGREANAEYQETLNGVQTKQAKSHQLMPGIDPYIKKGDKSSGLLPGIDPNGPGEEGASDRRVQAYNFRMCVTDAPANRIPFDKPAGYNELDYELLFRNFEAGETKAPWNPIMMPNRKTDANNNFGFSTDYIGMNYDWATGDYLTRDKIYAQHLLYQRGLMWTLANHPRVPEKLRDTFSKWGNCQDEFSEHAGWSHQIYVREARRMVSAYVMTQHNCQGREIVPDSVGLAAYTMDSHNTQRYVDHNGHVRNEGDVQVGGFPPYPIAYRSIVPNEKECTNLLVPVCLSATHIAYGSIRMEPVFMVLGQSAATAAVLALDNQLPVQQVDIAKLQERLLADKQILSWQGKTATSPQSGIDPQKLPGIVMDDSAAKFTGEWVQSRVVGPFVGEGYSHDSNKEQGMKRVLFHIPLPKPGKYEVRLAYTPNMNRADNAQVIIKHNAGIAEIFVNQRQAPEHDGLFHTLGVFQFDKVAQVTITNETANGFIVIDAVQLLPR